MMIGEWRLANSDRCCRFQIFVIVVDPNKSFVLYLFFDKAIFCLFFLLVSKGSFSLGIVNRESYWEQPVWAEEITSAFGLKEITRVNHSDIWYCCQKKKVLSDQFIIQWFIAFVRIFLIKVQLGISSTFAIEIGTSILKSEELST